MSRFVRPDVVVLRISGGDTLTVKKRLTSGEHRDQFARLYVPGPDGALVVNRLQTGLALITSYLVDWSLVDDDGVPVAIRGLSIPELESVLNALDRESFIEIKEAIEAHERAQDDERDRQKKLPAGVNGAASTFSSPSAPAGTSNGSATSTPTTTVTSMTSSPSAPAPMTDD